MINTKALVKSLWAAVVSVFMGTFIISIIHQLYFYIRGLWVSSESFSWPPFVVLPFTLHLTVLALIVFLVIGLPVQALLQRLKKNNWLWSVGAALVTGVLMAQVLTYIVSDIANTRPEDGSASFWHIESFFIYLGALCGAIYGSIFWLVRRPDKDAA